MNEEDDDDDDAVDDDDDDDEPIGMHHGHQIVQLVLN